MAEIPGADAAEALAEAIASLWGRYGKIEVHYERVTLNSLTSVIYEVARKRLDRAQVVLSRYRADGREPYLPVRYVDGHGDARIGFGPLVEVHEGGPILIDGTHRSLAAFQAGLGHICAVTIKPEHAPPPVKPARPLATIRVLDGGMDRLPPFTGKESKDFRPSALFTAQAERHMMVRAASEALAGSRR